MFRSLRSRLLLTYLLVTATVLALVGVSLWFFLLNNPIIEQLSYTRLDITASRLQRLSTEFLNVPSSAALESVLQRFDQRFRVRILLVNSAGEVFLDSRADLGLQNPNIFQGLTSPDERFRGSFADASDRSWLWVAAPVARERLLVVASESPGLFALREFSGDLIRPVLQAGALGLLISFVLAWLVSRWVAAPLQRMSAAARSVASGDYKQVVEAVGPREVQSMAVAFNEMVHQVQTGQQMRRDFLANVSHELKTPLTSIQGFAQALLDGAASDDEAREHAARVIYEESERLRRLVEDLLDLARLDAGQIAFEREPVNLKMLLESVVERLAMRAASKGISLENQMPKISTIIGDGDRLAQVFTNLLDNAIKHTPKDGRVVVRGETEAGWVSIHVDDSGPGIPSEDLSRIFERFYQVDKPRRGGKGRGVGLGLAISRQIAEAHGGRLVAQSALGKGSRFTIQLPIVRPDDETLVQPLKESS